MADYFVVSGEFLLKFKLIQACMHVLNTCKNEEDWVKMKALEWPQHFSYYKSMGIFPDAQGQVIGSGRI